MTITINGLNIGDVYAGGTRIKRIYRGGGVLVFGRKAHKKLTFTASGSIVFPDLLISATITAVGGGGASGGWANDRHGLIAPGIGGQGGKTIHSVANARGYAGKTCAFTVGAGGQPGAQRQWGKFCAFNASTAGGTTSVPLFGLTATGGYQGFTGGRSQTTDSQNGAGQGGNKYNGASTDAYPNLGAGAPLSTGAVASPGIAGKGGFVIIEYDYWE